MESGKKTEKRLGTVIITRDDGVATILMNRPEKLNALSPELTRDLLEAVEEIYIDESVRAVIVTGAGKSFCAGGDVITDVGPIRDMSPTEFNAYYGMTVRIYKALFDMEKPVIAAINGHAVGAGLEIALSCDLRIAAEDAKLGEFFVRMGIAPEAGQYLLPRLVGLGRAKWIAMLGDTVTAVEAERIGLVDKVVPPDKLISTAQELALRLAKGPKSISLIKKSINASLNFNFQESMDYGTLLQYQLSHTEDAHEAVQAFIEKRKPAFLGK